MFSTIGPQVINDTRSVELLSPNIATILFSLIGNAQSSMGIKILIRRDIGLKKSFPGLANLVTPGLVPRL